MCDLEGVALVIKHFLANFLKIAKFQQDDPPRNIPWGTAPPQSPGISAYALRTPHEWYYVIIFGIELLNIGISEILYRRLEERSHGLSLH